MDDSIKRHDKLLSDVAKQIQFETYFEELKKQHHVVMCAATSETTDSTFSLHGKIHGSPEYLHAAVLALTLDNPDFAELIDKVATTRYCQRLLNLTPKLREEFDEQG